VSGDGIALCGEARRSTTNMCHWRVRGHLCNLCFGHDGSIGGASTRVEDNSNRPTFQQATICTWWCKLRPGSSTDSAIDQCARRVGNIQNNGKLHSAASGRHATRGGDWGCIVGSTHMVPELNSANTRCIAVTQSLLQLTASRIAMEPSDHCTCVGVSWRSITTCCRLFFSTER
jgi:hypothetical protein